MRASDVRVAALLYLLGEEYLYALLIGHDGRMEKFKLAEWAVICPKIDSLWEALQGDYAPQHANSVLRSFVLEWGQRLLPPISSLLPCDVLVIIPHHTLHGLPIHAIWLEQEEEFLCTAVGVTYCSSGTLLARCQHRNAVRASDLSQWQFSLDDGSPDGAPAAPRFCIALGADVVGGKTAQYKRLASAFAEHFAEKLVFDGAVRYFKNRLSGDDRADAVCIVSHGYRDNDVSDNSGLLLEKDEVGISERPLQFGPNRTCHFRDLPFQYLPPAIDNRMAAELMTISELKVGVETDAQLVALFACLTGAGEVLSGDDFNSLAYQWLKIGAASVLANLWELDIDFAVEWSPVFLANWLAKRQPKALAYRQSMRQILLQKPQRDVFQWATVALFGDWL